jgi:hypothetical protein
MRSAALSVVALLLLSAAPPSESAPAPAPAAAAVVSPEATVDVSIQGPATAAGGFALVGSGPKDAVLRWRIEGPDGAAEPLRLLDASGAPVLVFMSPANGRYRVLLTGQVATDGLDPFGEATHVVTVGNVPPVPPGPQPPGPTPPGPVPPEPQPDAAPFPADGLHVLIVYETAKVGDLTAEQRAIILGTDVRGALDAAAPKRYRIYDQDADLQFVPQVWKDAMAVPRQSLPWLAISNGKTGFSGPLTMTAAEFRKMLEEYK